MSLFPSVRTYNPGHFVPNCHFFLIILSHINKWSRFDRLEANLGCCWENDLWFWYAINMNYPSGYQASIHGRGCSFGVLISLCTNMSLNIPNDDDATSRINLLWFVRYIQTSMISTSNSSTGEEISRQDHWGEWIILWRLHYPIAVSYTHLDVYKRQVERMIYGSDMQ